LRDVFTMGARPIANMNALRFGRPDHPKMRHLISGVVSGIGGYGNCVGVPTVGGEVNFHPAYDGNILVNAMTVGVADTDKIFYSAASGVGNPIVYVGSKTGRDGIHGATMASADFGEDSDEKRPTVQVGDVPGTHGVRRHRRHPGYGRGRPYQLQRRNGVEGRRWPVAGHGQGAPA
jgi:phosphoribosylformylglycinamidine synthase